MPGHAKRGEKRRGGGESERAYIAGWHARIYNYWLEAVIGPGPVLLFMADIQV